MSHFVSSQDTLQTRKTTIFSTHLETSKLDFFHNIQLNTQLYNFLSVESSIGVSISKTYFQQSFSPQFSLGLGYDVLRRSNKWTLIPMIKARTTMIDLSENARLSYLEGYLGYSLIYGEKWYVTHGGFLGRGVEFYNTFNSQAFYWSYIISLGIGYEF
jgi:hypothetical protein